MSSKPGEVHIIAPDYSADDMVWDVRGNGIAIERLPISEETREVLRSWQRRWDELASHDMAAEDVRYALQQGWPLETLDGKPREPTPYEVWAAHERQGQEIWGALRDELGSDWKVGWPATGGDGYWVRWFPEGPAERLR